MLPCSARRPAPPLSAMVELTQYTAPPVVSTPAPALPLTCDRTSVTRPSSIEIPAPLLSSTAESSNVTLPFDTAIVVPPPAIVSPEIVIVPSSVRVTSPLPRTVTDSAPGPFRFRPSISRGSSSAMVPCTALPKRIVSPLLALLTASRSEPSPSASVLRTTWVAAAAGWAAATRRLSASRVRIIIEPPYHGRSPGWSERRSAPRRRRRLCRGDQRLLYLAEDVLDLLHEPVPVGVVGIEAELEVG